MKVELSGIEPESCNCPFVGFRAVERYSQPLVLLLIYPDVQFGLLGWKKVGSACVPRRRRSLVEDDLSYGHKPTAHPTGGSLDGSCTRFSVTEDHSDLI